MKVQNVRFALRDACSLPSSIIVAVFEESFVPRANRSIRAEPRAVAAVHVGEVHIRGGGVRGGVFGEDEVGRVNGKIRIVPRWDGRRWGWGSEEQ